MKKIISGILSIAGVIVLAIGSLAMKNIGRRISKSIVIRGAKGPTSVFIAGKIKKSTVFLLIAAGTALLVTGMAGLAAGKEKD